jgi:hypothetical protein
MHERIVKRLDEISNTYDLRILYACESGSRAWGFASLGFDFEFIPGISVIPSGKLGV